MEASDGIRRTGSAVAATQLSDSVRLQVAIEHVIAGDSVTDAAGATVPVVSLRRAGGLRPIMVSVLAPENLRGNRREVCAILYLFDPDEDVAPLIKPVCKLYGLSPAETRLACALTSGVSLAEAATVLKIKEQTARTYLKQVFLKTDTKRQADLVRLMLTSIVRTDRGANLEII
jgi:DNA-binding CsgD family transcriptional regulator